jgi:hypothetical protein
MARQAAFRLAAFIVAAVLALLCSSCGDGQQSFDSTRWKQQETSRYRMLDDLVRTHLRRGAPQKPLFQLLGYPDRMSGSDYTYSRWWGECIRWRESDCSRDIKIWFQPPDYHRVDHVEVEVIIN